MRSLLCSLHHALTSDQGLLGSNIKAGLLVASCAGLAALPVSAAPLSLYAYDYAQVGYAVGSSSFDNQSRRYKFHGDALQLQLSKTVTDYFYVNTQLQKTKTDDADRVNGVNLRLNDDELMAIATFGSYLPLREDTHLIGEVGLIHRSYDSRYSVAGISSKQEGTDNDLFWKLGFKTQWMDLFEVNFEYFGAQELRGWMISSPTYLNEKLALDMSFGKTRNNLVKRAHKSSSFGIGLRYYF